MEVVANWNLHLYQYGASPRRWANGAHMQWALFAAACLGRLCESTDSWVALATYCKWNALWGLWCLQVLDRSQILEKCLFQICFIAKFVSSVSARFSPMVREGKKLSFQPWHPNQLCRRDLHTGNAHGWLLPWSSCIPWTIMDPIQDFVYGYPRVEHVMCGFYSI